MEWNIRAGITRYSTSGYALPTVLIASVVMLMILTTGISATVAIRTSLDQQRYDQLAGLAAEAGTTYAQACLRMSNNVVTWSDEKPLRPNTDCNGNTQSNLSPYVLERDEYRSYFIVKAPAAGFDTQIISTASEGYIDVLRKSTGIAWRVFSSSDVAAQAVPESSIPTGTSIEGYWSTAPAGYLLEDGSAVSRTTYSNLFAVIGTTFGAGNGSTTFNLPDSRGRVAVNKSTDSEFNTIGKKSGSKTHKLVVNEIPSDGYHRFMDPSKYMSGGSNSPLVSSSGARHPYAPTSEAQAHNNIQPSIVVTRAIKY